MEWNPSLSVGDVRIDDQHKRLFQLLKSLESTPAGENTAQAYAAVAELERYVREHLRDEEAVMRSFKYKYYAAHCELHREFEEQLETLVARLTTEDHTIILQDIRVFVQNWLVQHISSADLRYKPFLLS